MFKCFDMLSMFTLSRLECLAVAMVERRDVLMFKPFDVQSIHPPEGILKFKALGIGRGKTLPQHTHAHTRGKCNNRKTPI